MNNNKGIILILLSALMYGSYGVWSKLIGDSVGVFSQAYIRGIICTIILLPILIWSKKFRLIDKEDFGWFAVFILFGAVTQAPIFYAYNHMDIGSATLLFFVSMIVTMYILGYFIYRENISKVKILSFALFIIGAYLVFSFSLEMFSLIASVLAIIAGITAGGRGAISKKITKKYSTLYITWITWFSISIVNFIFSIFLKEEIYSISFDITWMFLLGYAIASILASWLLIEGLKYVEVGVGGLVSLLEIVFAIVFGMILFGEELTSKVLFGAMIIMLASALPQIIKINYINRIINRHKNG